MRRGVVLPVVLGVLLLLEALVALFAVQAERVRRSAEAARAQLLVQAALVEGWAEAVAPPRADGCAPSGGAESFAVSVAGTPFVVRRTPVDSALALVVVEAWVGGAARGRVVRLVRRAPGCTFSPVPPLPPPG